MFKKTRNKEKKVKMCDSGQLVKSPPLECQTDMEIHFFFLLKWEEGFFLLKYQDTNVIFL